MRDSNRSFCLFICHLTNRHGIMTVYCSSVKSLPTILTEPKTMNDLCSLQTCVFIVPNNASVYKYGISRSVKLCTHHVLEPVRVKVWLDALYLALVSMLPGSLPWLGSVRPKQPRISPRAAISQTPQDQSNIHSH